MKIKITDIISALIPAMAALLAWYSGYQAYNHPHGQTQSGWMMICMFAAAITLIGSQIVFKGDGLVSFVTAILCMVLAIAFAVHFFGGDQGVRELVRWLSWICQKISRVYADTFY